MAGEIVGVGRILLNWRVAQLFSPISKLQPIYFAFFFSVHTKLFFSLWALCIAFSSHSDFILFFLLLLFNVMRLLPYNIEREATLQAYTKWGDEA